ncbi:hypothetical protein VTO42DRAFT_7988 [Malbranchea cinnamomea]
MMTKQMLVVSELSSRTSGSSFKFSKRSVPTTKISSVKPHALRGFHSVYNHQTAFSFSLTLSACLEAPIHYSYPFFWLQSARAS